MGGERRGTGAKGFGAKPHGSISLRYR